LKLENRPDEFLQYCRSLYNEGTTESFGIKMHWWQLIDCLRLARQSSQFKTQSDWDILNTLFPNPKFIYLWRRDIAAQAVSAAIASQTGQWEKASSEHSKQSRTNPVKFQPWKIYEWEKSLEDQNRYWRQFFQNNHLKYYEITYEDLVAAFPDELAKVINHIGIEQSELTNQPKILTQRQSNATNRRFVSYYTLLPKPLLTVLYQLYRQLKPIRYGVGS
jgi:LPS sulfotransferase NodH